MSSLSQYLPLSLTSSQASWQRYMTRKADSAFLAFQKKISNRDHYTCQYCGFQSLLDMDIVNRDLNYLNNKQSNLVVACPFCAQCHFIQSVGISDNTGGVLIYLPEFSQAELNATCHHLFASMALKTATATEAKNIYRSLRLRSQAVEKSLGAGMSNPAFYGQVLLDADKTSAQKIQNMVDDKIRLLPSLKAFADLVNQWSEEAAQVFMNY